jgi:muramidase (phage lysozyme)
MELVGRESSWNPEADNPSSSAYGYGQFLNSTRKEYEKKYGIKYSTPLNQLVLTIHYVKDRYGDPIKALQFWDKNKWY